MNPKNSVGWILLLLFQCGPLTNAEKALELANSHLLPTGGHRKLINVHAEGYPRDCSEIFKQSEENSKDGLYVIQPAKEPIAVYCNMQDGGWTVIQHITANSTVDFDRTWQDYKYGFGSIDDNYWLGNEYMHQLTSSPTPYTLRIKLVDLNAEIKWGEYEPFHIESESSQYRIRLGLYRGSAIDALCQDTEAYLHDNQKFTTKDRDNDNYFQNCAKLEYNGIAGGGWWYDACAGANLNRKNVIYWQQDCNKTHMCKYAWMMVRPVDYHRDCSKVCPSQKDEL
ncbi:fibrinogen-like protein 1-like protein [Anolis carolinensis]|uniref:Fibrinogen C-terminal domain-containing protein n=1 Tax=Anolis carolinensis TaxID=28377 RepID=G1KR07_ANOCA|nr:PREDICTED: fibrinogen-like protein 1-like protein [Anolis carolinensis]|eukprot:XP_008101522.1 PREDICTED: fibrinogen-like protein 1-like protein [Anolis carolinensis]